MRDLEWISSWSEAYKQSNFWACHGSPDSDTEYLLEDVTHGYAQLRDLDDLRIRCRGWDTSLLLCGHTHIPRFIRVTTNSAVLNPGSVGLPAYSDGAPVPHKMEVGSPEARYAIAEFSRSAWRVCQLCVPYDIEAAAKKAELEGFQEWAFALRTGYAS